MVELLRFIADSTPPTDLKRRCAFSSTQERGCHFVPRLLEADLDRLRIVTTNCGQRVERLDQQRAQELFAELEHYGVRHDDPALRNVTYRISDGRFCLIDFEFATLLASVSPSEAQP